MNFRPELAELVIAGEKTVTRRLMSTNPRSPWYEGGCKLSIGGFYAVCPGRGRRAIGRVRIIDVSAGKLGDIDDADAVREGFGNPPTDPFDAQYAARREHGARERFKTTFEDINKSWDDDAPVWRVAMRLPWPTLIVGPTKADAERVRRMLRLGSRDALCVGTGSKGHEVLDGVLLDTVVWVDGWRHGAFAARVAARVETIACKGSLDLVERSVRGVGSTR